MPCFVRSLWAKIVCLLSVLVLTPGLCAAKDQKVAAIAPTVTISGSVTDASGAAIAKAKVIATNTATGQAFPAKSYKDGSYTTPGLPFGSYMVVITAPGFQGYVDKDVTVSSGSALTLNARLERPQPVGAIAPQALMAPQAIAQAIAPAPASNPQVITSPDPKNPGQPANFVRVTINGVLGPMGYVETPSLSAASQVSGVNAQAVLASQNFNFPSIVLYISAAPLVYAPARVTQPNELNKLQSAQETNRNPQWLDSDFQLTPLDENGQPLSQACTNGDIQILGLLPQQTLGGAKNQTVADVASGVSDVAGALASSYPGVGSQVASATKAVSVLFQDIFPPQPIAYQYSNMNGNCEFGWFFRPNTSTNVADGPASILGIQTGIILLKTKKNIKSISVSGQTLSQWSGRPSIYGDKLYLSDLVTLPTFTLPDAKDIDYNLVTDLKAFPALISKSQAEKILHITDDQTFTEFAKTNRLVATTASYDYVTNASLSAALLSTGQSPAVAGGAGTLTASTTQPAHKAGATSVSVSKSGSPSRSSSGASMK
jgi:Carboxypeptidase regulatory-like domain